MGNPYVYQQLILVTSQAAVVLYLFAMRASGYLIGGNSSLQFLLLSLLFADAAYLSYRNVRSNPLPRHFSSLLLLLGWQFLASLFEADPLSRALSALLLPLCLCQAFYFIQLFVFQASAYRFQRLFLGVCRCTCALSVVGFFLSPPIYAMAYLLQFTLSFAAILCIGVFHRRRLFFILKNQKRTDLYSLCLMLLFFALYIAIFHDHPAYLANIGSYLGVTLTFFSVHSILFHCRPRQQAFFALKKTGAILFFSVGTAVLGAMAHIFVLPLMALLTLPHIVIFLALLFNLLLYLQLQKNPENAEAPHFYTQALGLIKKEEALKKDFSNYLHDAILQDLLAIKNLLNKADQPEVKALLNRTLSQLSTSIRSQIQHHHPRLLKNLTYKENLQSLLDTVTEKKPVTALFHCSDKVFLVEPYNLMVYRMLRELLTNALKHSGASKIEVHLSLEHDVIALDVMDNGVGFDADVLEQPAHRGLSSIHEQTALLDGSLRITPHPDGGTQIFISIPMKGAHSYDHFVS